MAQHKHENFLHGELGASWLSCYYYNSCRSRPFLYSHFVPASRQLKLFRVSHRSVPKVQSAFVSSRRSLTFATENQLFWSHCCFDWRNPSGCKMAETMLVQWNVIHFVPYFWTRAAWNIGKGDGRNFFRWLLFYSRTFARPSLMKNFQFS